MDIFKLSTYTIWFLWLTLYWLHFDVIAFILLLFLSIIDTTLWFYLAHSKGIVSSRIWSDGLFKKCIRLFLVSWGIFFLANMAYVNDNNTVTIFLSAWVIILIMYRIIFEIISLVENLAIISSQEERATLTWISNILIKIVWIWQKKLDEKIERYQ